MPAEDIFPGTFSIFPSKNISDLRSQKSLSNLGLDKAYEYFFGTKNVTELEIIMLTWRWNETET